MAAPPDDEDPARAADPEEGAAPPGERAADAATRVADPDPRVADREERAAAAALARHVDELARATAAPPAIGVDAGDASAVALVRAAAGRPPRLGELASRAAARRALERAATGGGVRTRGDSMRGDGRRDDAMRDDAMRGDAMRDDTMRGDQARGEGTGRGRRPAPGWRAATAIVAVAASVLLAWRALPRRAAGTAADDVALPERLASRPAGMLVPGPFPAGQSAAARLDVVAADRLVALRELRGRATPARSR